MKRSRSWMAACAFVACAFLPMVGWSHDGEDHGAGAAPVSAPGSALFAVEGRGAAFEGVLKYKPFEQGEKVDLTLFVLSLEDNRPVAGATVLATLSEGAISSDVAFTAKQGGPAGAYTATVTVADDKPRSWLFDVTADDASDLLAMSGFQSGKPLAHEHDLVAAELGTETMSPRAFAATLGAALLLAGASFVFGRLTARKVPT